MAEAFELGDQPSGLSFGVGAVGEVVAAEVLVGDVVAEDVVDRDQDRVGDRDDRLVVPLAALDPLVLGAEVGVLGVGGGVGGLDQHGAQVLVGLAGAAGAALAGGLVVAETDRRPAGGMPVRGEAAHVRAELGEDRLRRALCDPGDRAQPFSLGSVGGTV